MNRNIVNGCVHDMDTPCSKDSDFYNETGGAVTDYSTNPAGVDPAFQNYLARNGVLTPNGDPLNTQSSWLTHTNADIGNFWRMVFPKGSNDCDLSAAIREMEAKVAQFDSMIDGNANKWVQAHIAKGGSCFGCQGDSAFYIMNGRHVLQMVIGEYKAEYQRRVAKGGGCSDNGLLMNHYLADQNTKRQTQIQLDAQKLAQQQENELAKCQQKVAAEGAGVATSVFSASSPISPITIGLVVGGALFIGIIIVVLKGSTKTVS